MCFNGLMQPAVLDPYLLLAAVASSDFSFLMTFPGDLRKVPVCSSQCRATLSTICCILVADILAVAPTLWTAPLSCVHVLIMMVPRSISRLSWLPLLGLAQAFGSREVPANLFHRPPDLHELLRKKKEPQHIHMLNCQGWKRNWVVSSTNGLHTCFEIQAQLQIL